MKRFVQFAAAFCVSLTFLFTGAVLSWPSPNIPKFNNDETNINITDAQSSWLVALVPLGALPGCYFGQILNDRVGRRNTVFASALPGLLGAILMLVTTTPEVMFVARFNIGISTGIIAVATIIYITEIADKDVRGALGMLVQVMNNLGSLIVYGMGPFVSYQTLNILVLAIPIMYVLLCLWIPESPYYHLKDGKYAAAKKELMFIKNSEDETFINDQLAAMRRSVMESMEHKSSVTELLKKKYRKAVIAVGGLKVLQYMTGSLVIQSYLEIIFRQSSSMLGPSASIVYGIVQLLAGVGATFLARYFGRRALMLTSCLGVAISHTTLGLYFYLQDYQKIDSETLSTLAFLPLASILSFNVLYTLGIGSLPYVMQAELFPINVKTAASSAATMSACIFSFVVAKFYQVIKDLYGHYTVFWNFAFVAYVGVVFICVCVPETKDKTLEEVQKDMTEAREEDVCLPKLVK